MKKVSSLILIILLLAGCAQALAPKEAAALFVDHLIYHKKAEAFKENFQEGASLSQTFQENETSFAKSFADGLTFSDVAVDPDEAAEISTLLLAQVQKEATYKVITEEKDNVTEMIYEVKGLDMVQLLEKVTWEIVGKIRETPDLAKDETKLVAETLTILKQAIPTIKARSEAETVTLSMTAKGGKWQLAGTQQAPLETLYLTFVSGFSDQEQLMNAMLAAIAQIGNSDETVN